MIVCSYLIFTGECDEIVRNSYPLGYPAQDNTTW